MMITNLIKTINLIKIINQCEDELEEFKHSNECRTDFEQELADAAQNICSALSTILEDADTDLSVVNALFTALYHISEVTRSVELSRIVYAPYDIFTDLVEGATSDAILEQINK